MRDRSVDVNRIDIRILQQLLVIGKPLGNAVLIGNLVQVLLVALAQGHDLGVGMALIDWYELGSETESDDGYFGFFDTHNSIT